MACCILFRNSSSSSSASSTIINNVRVVDLNGYVEEFDYPVTVSQVSKRPQKHFVFTSAQLLSVASLKPLKPETILEPGGIYFLLPSSAFGHEVSPLDLASIVKKLTAKAKSVSKSGGKRKKSPLSRCQQYGYGSSSPEWNNSPDKVSPNRMKNGGLEKLLEKRNWRPILDTITEVSSKGSHSDLPE